MKLLQLCAGQIRLAHPLPWNVRTAPGELLLSKGNIVATDRQLQALLDRGVYVDEDEYERHRQQQLQAEKDNPFDAWADMLRRTAVLLRDPRSQPQFKSQLSALSEQIHTTTAKDPDVGSFELSHAGNVGYPVLHSLQAAYLATLVCKRLHLSDAECKAAVSAALTMNLSMLALQTTLCAQHHGLSDDQKKAIHSHPQRSCALLQELGVDNPLWLQAVAHHHERPDGKGYPRGDTEVPILAQVLHHADVYLAKLSARRTRPALPVHEAARAFFMQGGGASNPVTAAVIKETGIYPPGCYVKLSNGEVAVVVRRGELANAPMVYSLSNAAGVPFTEPQRRDTRMDKFKVCGPVAQANVMVRFDTARLFGIALSA
jgi:HD-GYP domain-containing protein (c-di-GMP phosphodiesterase class II)